MNKWSRKYNSCANCNTVRFPYKAKGYCRRCYPLILKLEKIKNWDESFPDTWVDYPHSSINLDSKFTLIKKGFINQYSERLSTLKYNEKKLDGPISGLDLEYKIIEVAKLCGTDGGYLFGHDAGAFENHLNQEQRLFMYQKLHSIVEAKKWKGIDWYEVFK